MPPSSPAIRALTSTDWPAASAIYAQGISTGNATFAEHPPTWATFDATMVPSLRVAAVDGDGLLGWAAASPVSDRCVYAGVVEVSVYVAEQARRRGVGRALLAALSDEAERAGVWTLQAGIFTDNTASIALHVASGFRVVGVRERVGKMSFGARAGQWRDVVLCERRSAVVGCA